MSHSDQHLIEYIPNKLPPLTSSLVYNIPARFVERYSGRNLILRSSSPRELAYGPWRASPTSVSFIQLTDTTEDASLLEGSAEGIPLEIVLKDPAAQYQHLYKYKSLLDSHPIRVAIPVKPKFTYAAKLAISLNFAVKLEMEQPDEGLMSEVEDLLNLYLRRSFVNQPIEFFHSLLLSLYRQERVSLWEIAEEDPTVLRYVTDDGEETISRRFVGLKLGDGLGSFVSQFRQELIEERTECRDCEFFNRCGGYFKWPDRNYRCDGVKRMFRTLVDAAAEVRVQLSRLVQIERR